MTSKKPLRSPNSKICIPKSAEDEPALFTLLKKFSLQQYFKILSEKGYASNMKSLITLSEPDFESLLNSINFYPGHRTKFKGVINLLQKLHIKDTPKSRRSASHRSNSKEKIKRPASCKSKDSSSRKIFTKKEEKFEDFDLKSSSETFQRDLALELEEAKKKIQELTLKLQSNTPSPSKEALFNPFEDFPDVSSEKNPELGVSYDSSRMRSTLHYLDIEEICRCLSKFMKKMIVDQFRIENSESESKVPKGVLQIFNQHFFDPNSKTGILPCEEEIYNISKNIIIRCKMEKECSIICLIYIYRLNELTGICPNERNWKRLLLMCLILASKIWDDESYENTNFADVFSNITLRDINSMEITFLNLIDYNVSIKKSEYAKFYFILRTFASSKDRSFPLVPLNVDTVRKLQSSTNNAENKLRELYDENLRKTL